MKKTSTLLLIMALAAALGSCSSPSVCTLIACENGVSVVLTGAAVKFAADLPVTVKACVETSCSSFTIQPTGTSPICTSLDSGATLCTIDGEGTVVLTTVPLPAGLDGGVSVPVEASVTNAMGTSLFDGKDMVTLVATQPAGPNCGPPCLEAEAPFTP
jgi:hypothetical protein